jgi:hypothetical protein
MRREFPDSYLELLIKMTLKEAERIVEKVTMMMGIKRKIWQTAMLNYDDEPI